MELKLVMTAVMVIFLMSGNSGYCDDNHLLIESIKVKPKCNESAVGTTLANTDADADVLFAMLTSNCGLATPYFKDAFKKNGKVFAAAEKKFLDYADSIKPKVDEALKAGDTADAITGSFSNFSFAFGLLKSATDTSCKGVQGANGDGLKKICDLAPRMEGAFKDWSGPVFTRDSENRGKKLLAASTPEALCERGNRAACLPLDKKAMHGVTRPGSWRGILAGHYHLIQITGGFAVFADEGDNPMLIAVKQSSLKKDLQPGTILAYLQEMTDGKADCLKFLSEGTEKNQAGFSVEVIRFMAVECSASK